MGIQKHHIYQMWEADGTYLGVLQGVTSKFGLSQDINTIGPGVIQISIAQSADTPILPVKAITTEDGKWITTESGIGLTTEGESPNYAVEHSKIRNGNRVKVTEVSDYHPSGLTVFDGVVRKWRINFGTDDDSLLYVMPRSIDMNGYLVRGPDIVVFSQTSSNGTFTVQDTGGSKKAIRSLLMFNPAYPGAQILKLKMAADSALLPANVRVGIYSQDPYPSIGDAPLASVTTTVSSTTMTEYTINFPNFIARNANSVPGYPVGYVFITIESDNIAYIAKQNPRVTSVGSLPYGEVGLYDNGNIPFSSNANDELYAELSYVTDQTKSTYVNNDPSNMVKFFVSRYNLEGGDVTYDASSVQLTGITIPTYTFSVNTITEGLDTALGLSPSNFYYTVDPGSNILTFKAVSTTADFKLIYRNDITTLDLSASIENIENSIYFTGGLVSGSNIFKQQQDLTSQENFGISVGRINDINVTNGSTASQLAANYLDRHNDEAYETTVVVPDTAMDITQFKPGQTIGFGGFGTFVDSLVLTIVRIDRKLDAVTLSLGTLPERTSSMITQMQSQLDSFATIDNPNQPS